MKIEVLNHNDGLPSHFELMHIGTVTDYMPIAEWIVDHVDTYDDVITIDDQEQDHHTAPLILSVFKHGCNEGLAAVSSEMHGLSGYIKWHEAGHCSGKLTDFASYRAYQVSKIHLGTWMSDMHGQVIVSKPSWWKYITGETE